MTVDEYFISGPRNCTDPKSNLDGEGYSWVPDSCVMKSRLIGFEIGEYFDDLIDLDLLEVNEPMTKMVFWRYTCPRPCLGTDDIPGRNGHITSFLTRYGKLKSKFHGYPLLGGTKTAMRSFFNFTDRNNIHLLLYLLEISASKFLLVIICCGNTVV